MTVRLFISHLRYIQVYTPANYSPCDARPNVIRNTCIYQNEKTNRHIDAAQFRWSTMEDAITTNYHQGGKLLNVELFSNIDHYKEAAGGLV